MFYFAPQQATCRILMVSYQGYHRFALVLNLSPYRPYRRFCKSPFTYSAQVHHLFNRSLLPRTQPMPLFFDNPYGVELVPSIYELMAVIGRTDQFAGFEMCTVGDSYAPFAGAQRPSVNLVVNLAPMQRAVTMEKYRGQVAS